MNPVGPLPRLLLGAGMIGEVAAELAALGVARPLLVSDRGLERAGVLGRGLAAMPAGTAVHLDVAENPSVADADAAFAAYRAGSCDGVVALGGGSVIDVAKFVAALAAGGVAGAGELLGRPERIGRDVAALIAIPTTVGTGSESSHVAALHIVPGGPAIGTRGARMVPRVAICDPDLARTLPPRLVAATGIDALSHCIEGFFATPAHPVIDALALEGIARVFAGLVEAMTPAGDAARESLMVAAFAGGAGIHKGLGPAHAVALACGDQDLHHGTLIAIALPETVAIVAPHAPARSARIAAALGVDPAALPDAIRALARSAGLPATLAAAGYEAGSLDPLVAAMIASPFNRASPYVPSETEFRGIAERIMS